MTLNKSRLADWIIPVVIGFLIGEFWPKAVELWVENFGTDTQKTVQEYITMEVKSKEDSTVQEALFWKAKRDSTLRLEKAERDSIAQVEKQERELNLHCVMQEVDISRENPCQSSLVFYRKYHSLYGIPTMPGSLENPKINWLVGSTKCDPDTRIRINLYENGIFPLVLNHRDWVLRYFGVIQSKMITAQRINNTLNLCKEN